MSRDLWTRALLASGLGAIAKHVGLTLACCTRRDGTTVTTTARDLAALASLSRRSVTRALADLQAAGWVERVHRGRRVGTEGAPSAYRLRLPPDNERPREQTKAEAWLAGYLRSGAGGGQPATAVHAARRAAGHTQGAVRRASIRLQVRKGPRTWRGPWWWALPEDAP